MNRRTVRRLAWVGVALCVVALALGGTVRLLGRSGVTEANIDRIGEGMTLAEVEGILGERAHQTTWKANGTASRYWNRGPLHVYVDFTADGLVADPVVLVRRVPLDPEEATTPFDRLRALLGW